MSRKRKRKGKSIVHLLHPDEPRKRRIVPGHVPIAENPIVASCDRIPPEVAILARGRLFHAANFGPRVIAG